MPDEKRHPRERMVYSAVQLVRAHGATGTGVRDVVEHAGAPRGSFQHYFPGGKDQLVGEAVLWAADYAAERAAAYRASARNPTPAGLFAHMVKQWKQDFAERGYERGCPLMAAAADLVGGDSAVTTQLRAAIDRLGAGHRGGAGRDGRAVPTRRPAGDADAEHARGRHHVGTAAPRPRTAERGRRGAVAAAGLGDVNNTRATEQASQRHHRE